MLFGKVLRDVAKLTMVKISDTHALKGKKESATAITALDDFKIITYRKYPVSNGMLR